MDMFGVAGAKRVGLKIGAGLAGLCLAGLAGCAAGGTAPVAQPQITLAGAASVRLGSTQQFTANVTNTPNTAVTYAVNGIAGGSSTLGTISASGLYTPPAAIPSPNTVSITAVSVAVANLVSTAIAEAILNPIPVVTSAQATQSVAGTSYVLDVIGTGFVSGAQIQVAGAGVTTTFVSATEVKATITLATAGATVAVTVVNPNPGTATSSSLNAQVQGPPTVTVAGVPQVRLGSPQQYTATITNSTATAITWQVNGITNGSATLGTITSSGSYTPPATIPSPNTITISAVAQATPVFSGSLAATILNPIPIVTSAQATQTAPNGTNFLLDLLGSGFISTSQIQVSGSAVPTTFVSSTELRSTITVAAGVTTLPVVVTNPDPGTTNVSSNAQVVAVKASVQTAARLLDQATFGPTLNDISHVQNVGINAYLTEQFAVPTTVMPAIATPSPTVCLNNTVVCEQSEWWQTVLTGNDQLRQRVAFALSEILVVSSNMVNPQSVVTYHNTLANDAFVNFRTLMYDVSVSPAMGGYLNMLNSAKPAVVAGVPQIANENYARELMQLFTTGIYALNADGTQKLDTSGKPIPVYTEAQVQAFARAFTGWTYGNASGTGAATKFGQAANYVAPMTYYDAQHDVAAKILLNGTTLPAGQSTLQDLNAALDNIFQDPSVGPFICKQLIQHLVASSPSPAYVARVAAKFADSGDSNHTRGDMKAVITAILTDADARAGDTSANFDGGHLREPILYIANAMRGLGFTNKDAVAGNDVVANASYYSVGNYTAPLGQRPYASGSVFNFFPPDYVIPGTTLNAPEFGQENTASAVLRLTLANQLVFNQISGFTVDLSKTSALGLTASKTGNAATDTAALVDSLGVIFLHGQLPAQIRTPIINHVQTLTDPAQRVRVATYLVITASFYKVEH